MRLFLKSIVIVMCLVVSVGHAESPKNFQRQNGWQAKYFHQIHTRCIVTAHTINIKKST